MTGRRFRRPPGGRLVRRSSWVLADRRNSTRAVRSGPEDPRPLRFRLQLMLFYNNVAELRLFRGVIRLSVHKLSGPDGSAGGTDHLDLQLADLLALGVAIDAQEIGGADVVAARGGERGRQQRIFDLPQDPMIEAGRRQGAVEIGEIFAEVPLDGERKLLLGCG